MIGYTYNLAQAFKLVAENHCDDTAIEFDGGPAITYGALDLLSNQVAWLLKSYGVERGDRVGICTDKTLCPYLIILASIKCGAIYFAVDPKNPKSRLDSIIRQCEPKVLFCDTDIEFSSFSGVLVKCGDWRGEFPPAEQFSKDSIPADEITGTTPAYIMFTSGSTGTPKGAVITHANLLCFVKWAVIEYQFNSSDRHTHINPIYFDNSVFDIYSTFFSGGCLIPFETMILTNPSAISSRLERMGCTVWFSVPSMLIYLQVMREVRLSAFKKVRKIIFGGEGYPKTKLKELFDELGGVAEIVNVYGPTECTCICSSYVVTGGDFADLEGFPPLGNLIRNFDGIILSGNEKVQDGEIGELCLGGPCVGAGYFQQPEETKRAFVAHPGRVSHLEVVYRTGDLVRRSPLDGLIYFIGRADLQIKHQGHRIELEEIQHALNLVDGVTESAVLHGEISGRSTIVAVIAGDPARDEGEFRKIIKGLLPAYMHPGKYYFLEALPKNPNGKTDRRALEAEFLEER